MTAPSHSDALLYLCYTTMQEYVHVKHAYLVGHHPAKVHVHSMQQLQLCFTCWEQKIKAPYMYLKNKNTHKRQEKSLCMQAASTLWSIRHWVIFLSADNKQNTTFLRNATRSLTLACRSVTTSMVVSGSSPQPITGS